MAAERYKKAGSDIKTNSDGPDEPDEPAHSNICLKLARSVSHNEFVVATCSIIKARTAFPESECLSQVVVSATLASHLILSLYCLELVALHISESSSLPNRNVL